MACVVSALSVFIVSPSLFSHPLFKKQSGYVMYKFIIQSISLFGSSNIFTLYMPFFLSQFLKNFALKLLRENFSHFVIAALNYLDVCMSCACDLIF